MLYEIITHMIPFEYLSPAILSSLRLEAVPNTQEAVSNTLSRYLENRVLTAIQNMSKYIYENQVDKKFFSLQIPIIRGGI